MSVSPSISNCAFALHDPVSFGTENSGLIFICPVLIGLDPRNQKTIDEWNDFYN